MPGRILITGSSGQIGSELTEVFVRRYGRERVLSTDVIPQNRKDCQTAVLDVTSHTAVA